MRILQVIDKLNIGGAERVCVDLTNILNKNNIDVDVLCLLDKADLDEELHPEIQVVYLRRSNKYSLLKLIRLFRICREYDIVHLHSRHVLRYVGLLLLVIPNFLIPFKVVFQDHYGRIDIDQSISSLLKLQLSKVDLYLGVSSTLLHWYSKIFPEKNNHFLFSNIISKNTGFSRKIGHFGKDMDRIDMVMVGNFREQKNYEFAIELFSTLPDSFTLTIYGNSVDLSYFRKIERMINEYGLSNRISILSGIKSVQNELNSYNLALHCAESETGPLVAIEYLSNYLPFLMFDSGQVADQIRNDIPNLLMENYNLEDWKSKIFFLSKHYTSTQSKMKTFFDDNYSEQEYFNRYMQYCSE